MTSPTPTPPPNKRLNLKLIFGAVIVLCAVGLGISVLDRTMRARRDHQTLQWAEQAMKDGRYEEAAAQFAVAVSRHPKDAALSLKSGDAYYALSALRPEALQSARVAWQAAVKINPKNMGALQRLLNFQLDLVETRPTSASFRDLGQIAQTVSSISPADQQAATASLISALGPWFTESGPGNSTQIHAHDAFLNAFGDSLRQNPSSDRAILYYALASGRRAVELRQAGDAAAAQHVLDTAEHEILNLSQVPHPEAQLLYRSAEGLTVLSQANEWMDQLPAARPVIAATTQPATTQSSVASPSSMWPRWDRLDHRAIWEATGTATPGRDRLHAPTTRPVSGTALRCLQEARSLARRAQESVHPSDRQYVGTRLLEVHLDEAAGDLREAEQVSRDTLAAHPGNLRAQLALVKLLGDSRPKEAMELLDQPPKLDDDGPGAIGLARRELLAEASMQKARMHLDAASATNDPASRQAEIQKASTACDALAAMLVNDATSLKLNARLRMFQGRYADALRLLDRALAFGGGKDDVDLQSYRAASLLALHEPQTALQSLRRALELDPSRTPERLLLAQVLISEGRTSEAREQLELLEKHLPQDSRMVELEVRWLAAKNAVDPDDDSAKRLPQAYAQIPEGSVKQKLEKADLALLAGMPADAIRLLDSSRSMEPPSVSVAVESVRAMIAANMADRARAVLADALAKHPGDPALLAVQKSLDAPLSAEAYESSLKGKDIKEFLDDVHACRAAIETHDLPRAKDQMERLMRLRPDEPLSSEMKFKYDLAARKWSDAGVCADRLGQSNFDRVEGFSYLFQLEMAREQPFAAACIARQMTLRFPQYVPGWIDLGKGLQTLGRYDRAIDHFRHALDLDHDNVIAIKSLAACLEDSGQLQEADRWISRGRQLAPGDADLREMEFERQLRQGDPRGMLAAREGAAKREPQHIEDLIALARVYLQINRVEALSNPQGARDAVAKAVEILNGAVKKWPDDKDCAFWAAHAEALAGDVSDGKQILRRLCDRTAWSMRPEADEALADFSITWGDLQLADTALREAMARGDREASVARRRAAVLARLGLAQPALDALRDFPTDPLVQEQRIMIVLAAGQGAQAEKELKSANAVDPTNARVMTLLGILYSAEKNDAQAKLWLDRAVAAGDEELACRARGTLRLRERIPDLPGALQDLAIARAALPADGTAALRYSDACLRRNDFSGAARVLQGLLAMTPSAKDVRLGLITMEQSAAKPAWDQIVELIDDGRLLAPSDWGWDAIEAQMWSTRHEPVRAAALMRHAVQVAQTAPEVADVAMESQNTRQVRALIPSELWMLLEAQAYDAVNSEADAVISRYGSRDMVSAWAHHAKAGVERRTGSGDRGTAEYTAAFATAQAAGGFPAASAIAESISTDSGADEAIRQINAYVASADAQRGNGDYRPGHDARWDLLRIDLLRRNNELAAAAAEIDKLMPRLSELPAPIQIQFLRMAVVIYLQAPSDSQSNKAAAACLALLQRVPDDVWALNNMAGIYSDHSNPPQPQKALDYGERAYRSAGRMGEVDPQIADTYGWALAVAGHPSEAIELLKTAAERLDIPDIQYHLAETYLEAGSPVLAGAHLEAALEIVHRYQKEGRPVDSALRVNIANACWRAMGQTMRAGLSTWISRCSTASPTDQ